MPKNRREHVYEQYDPSVEGFGSTAQWLQAFTGCVTIGNSLEDAYSVLGVTASMTRDLKM